jgi:hypothetical protein
MANKELIRARLKVNHEPTINPMAYTIDMVQALNYYNNNHNSADYRGWFVAHFKKRIDFPFSSVSDFEYRIAGVLSRILANGNHLDQLHVDRIESEFTRIREKALKVKVVVEDDAPAVKKPTIQERMDVKVSDFLGEFAGLVDEYVTDKTNPNVGGLLKTMGITGPMGKKVAERVQGQMAELKELLEGKDKQLNEGYSNLRRPEQKKLLSIYETLMEKLVQAKVTVVRKTRVVKAKPSGVIVKDMKFKQEDVALKIKSIIVPNVIGAAEVWVFNTKTRNMQVYYAIEGSGITVKGTRMLNFDTEKSAQRKVRKAETVSALQGVGKRIFAQFFKAIKSKDGKPNGRTNEDCVIMAAFR